MKIGQLRVEGSSVGSVGTNIRIPTMKLAFDMGRCAEESVAIPLVFITHPHLDHIGGLAHHCGRRQIKGMSPPTYVASPSVAERLQVMFEAYEKLDGSRFGRVIQTMSPGDFDWVLPKKRFVRAFHSSHVVPTQGYAVWERRTRLQERYKGLPGKRIAQLKREGEEVTEDFEYPLVAYTGDTRIDALDLEVVRKVETLVLECTFLEESVDAAKAYRTGHIHIDHIIENADRFENKTIVLTHFSARYSRDQIRDLVHAKLPPELMARTRLLLNPAGT